MKTAQPRPQDETEASFLADYRPSYNEAAANERWTKALAWFERYL